jgi:hypothetical protein
MAWATPHNTSRKLAGVNRLTTSDFGDFMSAKVGQNRVSGGAINAIEAKAKVLRICADDEPPERNEMEKCRQQEMGPNTSDCSWR